MHGLLTKLLVPLKPRLYASVIMGLMVVTSGAGGCGGADSASAGPAKDKIQKGHAAFYGEHWRGRKTASGERFNPDKLTAAHRRLPFGTVVLVTNQRNGRSVKVRINDRGPYGKRKRVIDVTTAAAKELGMIRSGVAPVTIEIVSRPAKKVRRRKRRPPS
jgi:rare lipoprotein A